MLTMMNTPDIFNESHHKDIEVMLKVPSYVRESSTEMIDTTQASTQSSWAEKLNAWKVSSSFKDYHTARKEEFQQAGITSVLACLQAPIEVTRIKAIVEINLLNTVTRLKGFKIIHANLLKTTDSELVKELFMIFKQFARINERLIKDPEPVDFLHEVQGCGDLLKDRLRDSFFAIISVAFNLLKRPVTEQSQEAL